MVEIAESYHSPDKAVNCRAEKNAKFAFTAFINACSWRSIYMQLHAILMHLQYCKVVGNGSSDLDFGEDNVVQGGAVLYSSHRGHITRLPALRKSLQILSPTSYSFLEGCQYIYLFMISKSALIVNNFFYNIRFTFGCKSAIREQL